MDPISRIINIFVAPQETFKAEKEKTMWWLPLVLFLVLTTVGAFMMRPVTLKIQQDKVVESMEKQGMTQEQIDEALERVNKMEQIDEALERVNKMSGVMMVVPQIVTQFIMFLAVAGLWLFVANVLIGGSLRFVHTMSVTAYSWMVVAVGMLIKAPIMTAKESINVHFSPALLLSDDSTFLYKLLAQFDLFNIWCFLLVTIGLAVMTGKTNKQVRPWTVLFFLIYFVGAAAAQKAFGF